jgi:hypothetical protein
LLRRALFVGVALCIAVGGGFLLGRKSTGCRYVVTKQAEFIHLHHSSIVILGGDTLEQMFGKHANQLTLFYGFNRIITEKGERASVRSPLLPMGRSVRALFFSGDDWPDLLVPIYAAERQEQVLLSIDLQTHRINIHDRRDVSHAKRIVTSDGGILFE